MWPMARTRSGRKAWITSNWWTVWPMLAAKKGKINCCNQRHFNSAVLRIDYLQLAVYLLKMLVLAFSSSLFWSVSLASIIMMHAQHVPIKKKPTCHFLLKRKGLAKLGNIVADANVSQFSRAGNMCCGNKFCCSENKKCFCLESKTFLLPRHKSCVRNMFPSLATPGNITRNIVSATKFPSLARS